MLHSIFVRNNGGLLRSSYLLLLIFVKQTLIRYNFCDASIVNPNESLSSPKNIIARKGSSVQLYWNYTLNAAVVPAFFTFVKQTCSVNETMNNNKITTVAEKASQNGQLIVSSSLPSSLSGRLDVITSNNRLILKNVGYNDTWNHFYSNIAMRAAGATNPSNYDLKPNVTQVTVEGAPTFTATPAKSLEVTENGEITITADFDGNPQPTAEIEFPHTGTKTPMTVRMVYPFIYRADYVIKPVLASHCGRTVVTRGKNKIGEIQEISTINVILTISDPSLLAGKSSQDCVEVEWQKKESGACNVTYQVNYKTADGVVQFTDTVINKAKVQRCGIASSVNITDVELKINSTKSNAVFSASVSQKPIPPPTKVTTTAKESSTPTTYKSIKSTSNAFTATVTTVTIPGVTDAQNQSTSGASTGVIVGGVIGGVIFLVLIVLLVLFVVKRGKRGPPNDIDSNEPGYPLADKKESIYASADNPRHSHAQDPPTYAQPEQPNLVYGKLGEGGGRKGPKPAKAAPSDYADVMLDENGYPVVGGYTEDNVDSYTEGYGGRGPEPPSYGSRKGSAGKGSGGRRAPPPYTEPKLDEDGYPKSSARAPPVYAQVDKSRKKR